MSLHNLKNLAQSDKSSPEMPVLFVGHGNPMNAIEKNRYSEAWAKLGSELPAPSAILSISAHWLTRGTRVTAMEKPQTIHDFGGFPSELYAVEYPAPGSEITARETQNAIASKHVLLDDEWGFDHGTWSVLKWMYPDANIPVLQMSIDYSISPREHYTLGQELSKLRSKGVLILGSGNIVHNLRAVNMSGTTPAWAEEFDRTIAEAIVSGDDKQAVDFQSMGELARIAHPTTEHFLPLLYILGAKAEHDTHRFFNEDMDLGSVSMRSVLYKGSNY